jgi:hypothetical protein
MAASHAGCVAPAADARPPAEKYLREVWPAVTAALKEHGVGCELNLVRRLRLPHASVRLLTRAAPLRWRAP